MREVIIAVFVIVIGATAGLRLIRHPIGGAMDIIHGNKSDRDRILAYRGGGSSSNGLHVLSLPVKIEKRDYELMVADNSCARIKAGDSVGDRSNYLQQQWFAVSRTWTDAPHFPNSEGSSDDDGKTWYTEAALMEIPQQAFQVSPEEVIWHRTRVDELRAQGIDQSERVRLMTMERALSPWTNQEEGSTR